MSNWIDPKALALLRELSPEDPESMVRELVLLYLSQTRQDVEEMKRALSGNDLTNVGKIAHRLKSSSIQMGASPVSERSKQIEMNAMSSSLFSTIPDLVAKLSEEFEQTQLAFQEYLVSGHT